MKINQLAKKINSTNIRKGFWDKPRNEGEILMLVVTELSEMIEANRVGRSGNIRKFEADIKRADKFKYSTEDKLKIKIGFFQDSVKDCEGDELADAFIRLCDYCVGFKIDIDEKWIQREVAFLKERKLNNLGAELLNISGMLNFLSRGFMREIYTTWILARLVWLSKQLNIPLEKHIKWKMWYNETRPKMHNKKY